LDARLPIAPDHLFQIGSITKIFTAIAIVQLHETGQLDLHTPITEYLPWFQVKSKYASITPHHLLSHTAGIITGTDFTPMGARYCAWALCESEIGSPPGSYFHYSNIGYWVLGFLLEDVLGKNYGDIIQEQILNPLQMRATTPTTTHHLYPRFAVGYRRLYDDRPSHPSHPLIPAAWVEVGSADGGIASTAADMATFVRMILNRGEGVLSETSFDLLTQPVIEAPFYGGCDHGYGLAITEMDGHQIILYDGGMLGYLSYIAADMDAGLGAVVLLNGPGEMVNIGNFALQCLRTAQTEDPLPVIEPSPDFGYVENTADYADTYRIANQAQEKSFTFISETQQLILLHKGERIKLEWRDYDRFYVAHPDLDRFTFSFDRDETGAVVEVWHGYDWYINDGYNGSTNFDYPAEWNAYVGHYCAHNPWFSNFRIFIRKGQFFMDETELVSLGNGSFRVNEDERSPERLQFDTIVKGQALRANYSGCFYYRFFTP
jgi:CubicO group peptidase (beta-lactamase class C family)